MGYCTDCSIFIKCPWFCDNYEAGTEEPKSDCWSKESLELNEE
ncbi:hypothetical protein bcgnr5390_10530 [Bacillus luti]|nr:hypothetical protein BC2903_30380 [Bacillus cereus]